MLSRRLFRTAFPTLLRQAAPLRGYCEPTIHPAGPTLESPLSPEELARHLDAEKKWQRFADDLTQARKEGTTAHLEALRRGLQLAEELGKDLSRPGYEGLLHLEAAQELATLERADEAYKHCCEAEKVFAEFNDQVGLVKAQKQKALNLVDLKRAAEAEGILTQLLSWAGSDAKKGSPMVQQAASDITPGCHLGLAHCYVDLENFGKAHEHLAQCLPHYAEKKNFWLTWSCLLLAEKCFRGLKDARGVERTLERQVSWAKRFEEAQLVKEAEDRLATHKAAQ